jgi:multidrug efflux pump subunit AcrB
MVHVDADRANLAHVTNADVSDSVDAALHGITAGVLREGDKQIPIVGRMRMEERARLSDLRSLYVFSRQNTPPVPLDQVATVALEPVTSKTKRLDQYPTITVQCWPAEGHLPSEVIAAAMPKLKEFQKQLPDGFIFRFAGEQKEAAKTSRGLGLISMEERLKMLNGTFSIESRPEHGTTIHARVPFSSDLLEP